MALNRDRLPVQEITTTGGAVQRDLVRAQDHAGERVSCIADAGHVAPGIGGIARVNANRIAVNAANRFARHLFARSSPLIAQNELIRRERDRLVRGADRAVWMDAAVSSCR